MATLDQLQSALVKADAAGDADAARAFAAEIRRMRSASASSTPAAPMDVNPTRGFGSNLAAGTGKFVVDTARGAQSLLNDLAVGAENMVPAPVRNAVNTLGDALGMKRPQQVQAEGQDAIRESRRLDRALMQTAGGNIGYVAAGIATAPLLPATTTIRGGAALGAGLAALQPALDWEERGSNALIGALTGGATQGAVNGLARIISPRTDPAVRTLMNQGITPTPGQILGGAAKKIEEALTSVPVLGDAIKAGQRRAVTDLNRVAINRALEPVGESLPRNLTGREAIEYAGDALGRRYEALLPQLSAQVDPQFTQQISSLRGMVSTGAIDPRAAQSFQRILNNDVLAKFQGQGAVTGQTLKQIESDLGQQISRLASSTDADQRLVADALQEAQAALRGLVARSNPNAAQELNAINTGWANFKRVQKAAASVGAEDGVFSAAQLQSAVKAMDRSKDKGAFARGGSLLQDLSDPAKAVLGNTVPDSGTALRTMTAAGGGLAVGGGLGVLNPSTLAALAAAPVMYSRPGQNAMAALLAQRPQGANRLAELVRQASTPAVLGNTAIAVQQ